MPALAETFFYVSFDWLSMKSSCDNGQFLGVPQSCDNGQFLRVPQSLCGNIQFLWAPQSSCGNGQFLWAPRSLCDNGKFLQVPHHMTESTKTKATELLWYVFQIFTLTQGGRKKPTTITFLLIPGKSSYSKDFRCQIIT